MKPSWVSSPRPHHRRLVVTTREAADVVLHATKDPSTTTRLEFQSKAVCPPWAHEPAYRWSNPHDCALCARVVE
jgi:hypothetical protein